ncbi:hypothetical protein BDV11DRAFT_95546 [Aspergillus similis]
MHGAEEIAVQRGQRGQVSLFQGGMCGAARARQEPPLRHSGGRTRRSLPNPSRIIRLGQSSLIWCVMNWGLCQTWPLACAAVLVLHGKPPTEMVPDAVECEAGRQAGSGLARVVLAGDDGSSSPPLSVYFLAMPAKDGISYPPGRSIKHDHPGQSYENTNRGREIIWRRDAEAPETDSPILGVLLTNYNRPL